MDTVKLHRYIFSLLIICCVFLFATDVSSGRDSISKELGIKIKTIYIDPLYGGKERGPIFEQKTYGKNITLLIAQKLQALLTGAGFTVYLSREGDKYISLETRTLRSKAKGADIYLAINVSNRKKDCIRLLTTTPPKERKPIQHIETKKLSELNSELNEIFKSLQEDERLEESVNLATKLAVNLQSDQHVDCIKIQKHFDYILLNTAMPAVTVDFGISKQSHKSPYILNTETQDKILAAIAGSIKAYADERSPVPNH